MTNTISRYDFEEAIETVGYEDIREDYSGRGMFGKVCIGVTVDRYSTDALKFALIRKAGSIREDIASDEDGLEWDTEEELADNLDRMAESARVDNMGLDMIVYFPGWEFE